MADKLTAQQRLAVVNRGGNLLISAAAGSGKTKVLVERLLSYLTDSAQPANLDDFLIITYTKAAATELRGKIAARLSEAVAEDPENRHLQQQLQRLYLTKISTVHGFCAEILREYAYVLDIPSDFRVAEETECVELQLSIIDQLLENAYSTSNDPDFFDFIDTQGFGRDDRQVPELLLKVYNSARCHLKPNQWMEQCLNTGNVDGIHDAAETIWGKYVINELYTYLDLQIEALEKCLIHASASGELEKPAALLGNTISQLVRLRNSKTWDEICEKLNIDFGRLTFPKKCKDTVLSAQIKAIRTACKKGIEKRSRRFTDCSTQILEDINKTQSATRGLIKLVKQFTSAYDTHKYNRHILDYGDLEHKLLDLILGKDRSAPTSAAEEIGQRYREVMVDEYQDSNAVQDAIFSALTHRRHNCFMVGDVKQSIYQFRLADPSIFLKKYNSFAHAQSAKEKEGRKVLLSSNFRSCKAVIDAVNDVFSTCMSTLVGGMLYGELEKLNEGIPHNPLHEPEIELHCLSVQQDTYAEEAAFTADRISELLDGTHMIRDGAGVRAIRPEDIVILLRSPGSVGGEFCYALEQRGICCTTGSNANLMQAEEVAVLYALLQTISNPQQDIPLVSVLTSRVFCFSADELAALRSVDRHCSIYSALRLCQQPKAKRFLEALAELRAEARLRKIPELLEYIFRLTKLNSVYAALPDGTERVENLQLFYQIAVNCAQNGQSDLTRFLEYLTGLEKHGLSVPVESDTSNAVTIMSIHKSKGLEFPVVFLCGLSREFNRESARAQVLCDKELGLGLSCVDTRNRVRYPTLAKTAIAAKIVAESLSEEMRVLYVAMTRARDRLIMTYASANLADELAEIAMRMHMSSSKLLAIDVNCPGKWIIMTALAHTEAGELFALGGSPVETKITETQWFISVSSIDPAMQKPASLAVVNDSIAPEVIVKMKDALMFRYPYLSSTQMPSKLTATQMKGRTKDHEAAEYTQTPAQGSGNWRKPSFVAEPHDGRNGIAL